MCDIIELDIDNEEIKSVAVATKEEQPKRPRGRPPKVKEEIEKVPKTISRPRKYEIGQKVIYERNQEYFKEYFQNRICKEINCSICNAQLLSVASLRRHEKQKTNMQYQSIRK